MRIKRRKLLSYITILSMSVCFLGYPNIVGYATGDEPAATEAPATPDTPEETTAKVVTETVAEAEDVLAEATDAVSNAADSDTSDVIGDEYMGLSDVSEDPSVLSEQDKLDV